jgi:hypothetical protein
MQAHQQGITLITVPYWWDRTPQRSISLSFSLLLKLLFGIIHILLIYSLIATIKQVRPDLFPEMAVTASPIPIEPPPEIRRSTFFVEDIGEPSNACFLPNDMDPTGWYVLLLIHSLNNTH